MQVGHLHIYCVLVVSFKHLYKIFSLYLQFCNIACHACALTRCVTQTQMRQTCHLWRPQARRCLLKEEIQSGRTGINSSANKSVATGSLPVDGRLCALERISPRPAVVLHRGLALSLSAVNSVCGAIEKRRSNSAANINIMILFQIYMWAYTREPSESTYFPHPIVGVLICPLWDATHMCKTEQGCHLLAG